MFLKDRDGTAAWYCTRKNTPPEESRELILLCPQLSGKLQISHAPDLLRSSSPGSDFLRAPLSALTSGGGVLLKNSSSSQLLPTLWLMISKVTLDSKMSSGLLYNAIFRFQDNALRKASSEVNLATQVPKLILKA